jgi:hypothetical protein
VYAPADLGLDNVVVAAAGGIVNGTIVPWMASYPWKRLSLVVEDESGAGATPGRVEVTSFDFDNVPFVSSVPTQLWTGFTNNPRTQQCYVNGYNNLGVLNVGTLLGIGVADLFSAPYIRFSLVNNHATIVATLSLRALAYR